MKKFLAVVKREYVQRVRTRFFVVATILGPLMMLLFTVVPAFMAGMKAGGPTRVAIVDQTGRLYERFRSALSRERDENADDDQASQNSSAIDPNSNQQDRMKRAAGSSEPGFEVEEVKTQNRSVDQVKAQLSERIRKDQLDAYVIIPADILAAGKAEFYGRNTGDIFTRETVESRLSAAVRDERLAQRNVPQSVLQEMTRRVSLSSTKVSARGEEKDSGGGFFMVFGFGFLIYLSVLMYGQVVLGAVIEEKETRIAEILFSSMRSFPLMMGKLIGVSLVALTQLTIWVLAFVAFSIFGVSMLASRGLTLTLPHIPPIMFAYFGLYFLLGYFIYATVYALIGSMVTTTQEGGQLAMPVVLMLVAGFYFAFPIIRSPNSSMAFWASMFPFFAPITMLVRIVTETPPFWQIALSLGIGFATVVFLVWLASRIYRVGMLMTGKKASIPEVWRWVRQQ
jgi:ABC-2 type transport system permease protein